MLKNLAHPRKRSVSVGPQSAADAYETLAYRNRRRRESINSLEGTVQEDAAWSPVEKKPSLRNLRSSSRQREKNSLGASLLPTPAASRVHSYEQMMGTGHVEGDEITPPDSENELTTQSPAEAESEKREIFMQLMKPRVRYDVEVVTKLIIYSGKHPPSATRKLANSMHRYRLHRRLRQPHSLRICRFRYRDPDRF